MVDLINSPLKIIWWHVENVCLEPKVDAKQCVLDLLSDLKKAEVGGSLGVFLH